jgi:hypothetical protein
MAQQYFYDEQIRRFLLQFARMVSNFQVEYGRDDAGNPTLLTVPVKYGDWTRQAQSVLQNNSASTMPSVPLMTFYVTALEYARDRVQEPFHVNKMHVRQRTWDSQTESYESTQGNAFTVERLMPSPYNLSVALDIWTSNTNQKMQLLEQLIWLFNPSMEIQSTDNYIDWSSLSVVELDQVTWSSRTIPQGTDDPIDIASLRFKMPIWISPPARVKKLGVIEKIIASVYDANGDAINAVTNSELLLGTRQKISPYGYQVLLLGNQLQILTNNAVANPRNNSTDIQNDPPNPSASTMKWHTVVDLYGTLRPGISQIRLDNRDGATEIVGTIAYHPSDDRFMLFTLDEDTVPANTIPAVDGVIDPLRSGPNAGLPAPDLSQRYLLLNGTGGAGPFDDSTGDMNSAEAWRGTDGTQLEANANDVIEYDGTKWQVIFDASDTTAYNFVTNINTGIQYKWDGQQWLKSYEGLYPGGQWSLVL